ncbi:MAG: C-terminal binding protein [Candidatus Humimicrobiaceae bacterium]
MKFKVVKTDNRYEDILIEKDVLNKVDASLEEYNLSDEDKIIEVTENVDGIITDLSPISRKVIESLKKCRVISKVGIGVDNIDVKAATEKGIFVCNVPNYCIPEVTDHATALILNCLRNVCFLSSYVKKGIWSIEKAKPILPLDQIVLGIVGFGNIGRSVYKKAKAFDFEVILFDPYLSKEIEKEFDVKLVDFDYLLRNSDVISIHCPSNSETYHMFSHYQFEKMKTSSFIVNTARGMIVDSSALYISLKNRIIAGAAVDVYDPEPIKPDDPILKLDNFTITPHLGFYSERSIREVRVKSALNVAKVLVNEEPVNIINKEVISK